MIKPSSLLIESISKSAPVSRNVVESLAFEKSNVFRERIEEAAEVARRELADEISDELKRKTFSGLGYSGGLSEAYQDSKLSSAAVGILEDVEMLFKDVEGFVESVIGTDTEERLQIKLGITSGGWHVFSVKLESLVDDFNREKKETP